MNSKNIIYCMSICRMAFPVHYHESLSDQHRGMTIPMQYAQLISYFEGIDCELTNIIGILK